MRFNHLNSKFTLLSRKQQFTNRWQWIAQIHSERFNGCAEQNSTWKVFPSQPFRIINPTERDWMFD